MPNLKIDHLQQESLLDPFGFGPDFIFALYVVGLSTSML